MSSENQSLPWQPARILRLIETLGSSTRPLRVNTDAGDAFIKTVDNDYGPAPLIAEFVCYRLGGILKVPMPDAAVMPIQESDQLPGRRKGEILKDSLAFASRALNGANYGRALLKRLTNPTDIVPIVLLDTWTLNVDRYAPKKLNRHPNPDNLFAAYVPGSSEDFRLVAIDQGHALTGGRPITRTLASIEVVRDESLYGLFPEFKRVWKASRTRVLDLCKRLELLSRGEVDEVVDSIPRQWGLTQAQTGWLGEFILNRARFLADHIPRTQFPVQYTLPETVSEESGGTK